MTKKLFVLDTNVLLHDPQSLFRFDEHDIYIPLITLEEMDAHKVGMTDVARNARQASRYIDELFSKEPDSLTSGIPLNLAGHKEARGKLILQTSVETASLPDSLLGEKADNLILGLMFVGLRTHTPERAAALSGMAQSLGYLLAAVAPPLLGLLQQAQHHWHSVLWILSAAAIIVLINGLLSGRNRYIP